MTNHEFTAFEESKLHVENLTKALEVAKDYCDSLSKKCDHKFPDGKSGICYHFCRICGKEMSSEI